VIKPQYSQGREQCFYWNYTGRIMRVSNCRGDRSLSLLWELKSSRSFVYAPQRTNARTAGIRIYSFTSSDPRPPQPPIVMQDDLIALDDNEPPGSGLDTTTIPDTFYGNPATPATPMSTVSASGRPRRAASMAQPPIISDSSDRLCITQKPKSSPS
jgi:hypothetical protein